MKKTSEKIEWIEFLRFLAIGSVVIFHFTARQSSNLTYGHWVSNFPFSHGWLGVELFFIVSGFVITYSLHRTNNVINFFKFRIIRIYPILILLLPIVYLFQKFTPYSPYSTRTNFLNLFSSMTLIPPVIVSHLIGKPVDWVTLVLWSLKVEVLFYITIGLIYYYVRNLGFYKKTTILYIYIQVVFTLSLIFRSNRAIKNLNQLNEQLGYLNLSWFVIGICIYFFSKGTKDIRFVILYLLSSLGGSFQIAIKRHDFLLTFIAGLFVAFLPLIFLYSIKKGYKIKNGILLSIGNSSYELYLVHQGVGVPIVIWFNKMYIHNSFCILLFALFIIFLICYLTNLFYRKVSLPLTRRMRLMVID